VKMDDPNITMEECIRREEEKAQRHGRTFKWQTVTFGKIENYEDEDDCFIDFEIEFPAIVFDIHLNLRPHNTHPRYLKLNLPVSLNISSFETSLSEYDEEEQNTLRFSDSFLPEVVFPNDPKMIKDSDDNIGILQRPSHSLLKSTIMSNTSYWTLPNTAYPAWV
ncbi:hypothetical protein Tco_0896603, partial [Tanacetum coccineum]